MALRVALAFQRPDVDAFLQDVDYEQYDEWCAFFQLEPQGWNATNIATTRLSYLLAQANSRKKLRERDYEIKLRSGDSQSADVERARLEAASVQREISELRRERRERKRQKHG